LAVKQNKDRVCSRGYYLPTQTDEASKKITFKPRQAGTNSINIKRIVGIGWKSLGDFRSLRKHIDD
jgi:hypothetical protein